MYNKITGFADEIAQELDTQIESLQKLGIRYVEMRGVDGNNLIYHSDEKVKEIKKKLDDAGIALVINLFYHSNSSKDSDF